MDKKFYIVKGVLNSAVPGFKKSGVAFEVVSEKFADEAGAAAYANKMLLCNVIIEEENAKSVMPLYESVTVDEVEG